MQNNTKRVFIVHGWGGSPEEGWFPWLKSELEKKGFTVNVPAMPDTDEPHIQKWVSYLRSVVGIADKDTYFVGHSIGCQTVLRYLESLSGEKVGGAVFVAGFFESLTGLETEEEKAIAQSWLETPIDTEKIKEATDNFVTIFSDNDQFIPLQNKEYFERRLGAKAIVLHDKGHFSGSDDIKEIPEVLAELLKITK